MDAFHLKNAEMLILCILPTFGESALLQTKLGLNSNFFIYFLITSVPNKMKSIATTDEGNKPKEGKIVIDFAS